MLKIESLNVKYGDIQALWDVSLEVNAGEIVALIGSNGAGKSTLLKTIAGLLKSHSGRMEYNGILLNSKSPNKIVELGISMVLEGRRLFPKMTALENLEVGAYLKKARLHRQSTLDWIWKVFPVLKERSEQMAGSLSGGEQQMLAIGRALMARNKFLILDEMSLGLSPLLVKTIFKILLQINKSGISIFNVEQNVPMTLKIAHRAYILENGHIVGHGDARSLLKSPQVKEAYLGIS
ncbi:MAG TPA: ABC transporter ATP-binding protein [Thermodesulfobacteriota bacterium]|nr:ABC transporter ATP-binding protein [Thermodesulfobacteriota bacterium]